MSGYFDEKEPKPERPKPERPQADRELTLGTGALIGIILGLLLLCVVCFALGYAVGHRGSASAAPDHAPLQSNDAIPKPSAAQQTAVPAPQTSDPASPETRTPEAETPGAGEDPTQTQPNPGTQKSPDGRGQAGSGQGSGQGEGEAGAAPPVRSALPAAGNTQTPAQTAPYVRAALTSQAQWMVQIAAVEDAEDADVLVTALRNHGYSVSAKREPGDGQIHVKIGPFSTQDEADRWRDKLLGDGYNAVVQP